MSHAPVCMRPISVKERINDPGFNVFADYERMEAVNQVRPYILDLEINSRCAGACKYCFASSDTSIDITIPRERILRLVDEAAELGIKFMFWGGGDPLLYPGWDELVSYSIDKGIKGLICTNGLISKSVAKRLCELIPHMSGIVVHISTINPEAYNKLYTDPKGLEQKVKGYHNLLEAGCPGDAVTALITGSKPALETVEETMDWYVDEMGCRSICMPILKLEGFSKEHHDWEPSLSLVRKAMEYRAKKLGDHWLRIGSSDGSQFYCRTNVAVSYKGEVMSCLTARDVKFGSIYEESLKDIIDKHRDEILFNFEVNGACGTCKNNDICFGCRSNAYWYTGDIQASDPKCFLNPEAKETYCR